MRKMRFYETPAFILVTLAIVSLLAGILFGSKIKSNELTDIGKYIDAVSKNYPENHFIKNPDNKKRYVQIIRAESMKYGYDPALIVSMIHLESKFVPTSIGDGGTSHGNMQVKKQGIFKCKCKKTIYTIEGGVKCGTCWLDEGERWCKSFKKGLNAYVHGQCSTKNTKDLRKVQIRIDLAKKLRNI
jgi:hypothetical protein